MGRQLGAPYRHNPMGSTGLVHASAGECDPWDLTATSSRKADKGYRRRQVPVPIGVVMHVAQAQIVWERRAGKSGRQGMGDNAHSCEEYIDRTKQ